MAQAQDIPLSPKYRFTSAAQELNNDVLHVVRFVGTEGLNSLYSFTINLVCRNADLDTTALLNAPALFAITREGQDDATFGGYPSRVEHGGEFHGWTYYTVELRPDLWKSTFIHQSSIFLNKNLQDTIKELLTADEFHNFTHEFRFMRSDYPVSEFAMQYDESVYSYIVQRLEDQGAYYYFEHNGTFEHIVFADQPESHSASRGTLSYSPVSNLEGKHVPEVITSFRLAQSPLPRRVVIRSYDWKQPTRPVVGVADVDIKGMGDVYLPHEKAYTEADAKRLAAIRAEELVCRSRLFHGESAAPLLRPGVVFTLEKHPAKNFNTNFMVTEMTHEGSQETFLSMALGIPMDGVQDHVYYRNSFTCIEASKVYRPARITPPKRIDGVIHAFIDAAGSGARPELDEYGRYKILFPFDVSGRNQGKASCWVRMAQQQVGRNSGISMPLCAGVEVIVSFIDGNPDLPVITGALANGDTGTLTAQGNPNYSGMRTAGGNQVSFMDEDKHQGIDLRTPSGSGMTMSAGSLDYMTTNTGTALDCCTQTGADIASFGKSMISGYRNTAMAARNEGARLVKLVLDSTSKWVQDLTTICGNNRTDDKAKADHSITADTFKMLTPLADLVLNSMIFAKGAEGENDVPYNVRLSASEGCSVSKLRVVPNITDLVVAAIATLGGNALKLGSDLADASPEMQEKRAKETYQNTYEKAYQLINGKDLTDSDKESLNCGQGEDFLKKIDEKIKEVAKYVAGTRDKPEYLDAVTNYNNLLAAKAAFKAAYEGYCNSVTKGVAAKYLYPVAKDTYHNYVTSGMADVLTEIIYNCVIVAYTAQATEKTTKLGGVSVLSGDSNVNIAAAQTVSMHSKEGIVLNALADKDPDDLAQPGGYQDAVLNNFYDGYAKGDNTSGFYRSKRWGNPLTATKTVPTHTQDRSFMDITAADCTNLTEGAEVNTGLKNKKYIANLTEIFHTNAQYSLEQLQYDKICYAPRQVMRTPNSALFVREKNPAQGGSTITAAGEEDICGISLVTKKAPANGHTIAADYQINLSCYGTQAAVQSQVLLKEASLQLGFKEGTAAEQAKALLEAKKITLTTGNGSTATQIVMDSNDAKKDITLSAQKSSLTIANVITLVSASNEIHIDKININDDTISHDRQLQFQAGKIHIG